MFESKETDTINNTDVYDTYTDICSSKKITTQDNAIEKSLDRRFAVPLDFNFFGILSILMD